MKEAISGSREANYLVEHVTGKGNAKLNIDGLASYDELISAGLMYIWK